MKEETEKENILSVDEVKHIAGLAKLSLTEEEVKKFQKQLTKIFEFINIIGEMETNDVKETAQTTGNENIFRQDLVDFTNNLSQKEVLSNAPSTYKGYFKVKAILEKQH